jgi:diguanylate cyclase (GGDEF)-like protein
MTVLPEFESLLQASQQAEAQGRHAEGALLAEQALALSAEPRAHALLALHRMRLGDVEGCLSAGEAALPRLVGVAHSAARSRVLSTLVMACLGADLLPQAFEYAVAALAAAHDSGDAAIRSLALNRMGLVQESLGKLDEGDAALREALAIATQLGDAEMMFASRNNLASLGLARAEAARVLGQDPTPSLRAGLASLQQAQAGAIESQNVHRQAVCLINQAEVFRTLGEFALSLAASDEATALTKANGLENLQMGSELEAADTLLVMNQPHEALARLVQLAPCLAVADGVDRVHYWRAMSDAHRAVADYKSALEAFEQHHQLVLAQAKTRSELQARLLIHQHELEQARHHAARLQLDVDMQRLRADQFLKQAYEDALTGLYNRRFVELKLPPLRQRATDLARPLFAALLDADHFKRVNDTFGHGVGDVVLKTLGTLIQSQVRTSDLAARYGGEEFLLLLPDTDAGAALDVCERLRRRIELHDWQQIAPDLHVTVSLGLAQVPAADVPVDPFSAADAALYRAKAQGRNQVATG